MNPPKTFKPECVNGRELTYSSTGYIIPCCNIDNKNLEAIRKFGMLKDKFHLSNVEYIDDILESDEWLLFYDTLQYDYDNVHEICKNRCSPKFKERILMENI